MLADTPPDTEPDTGQGDSEDTGQKLTSSTGTPDICLNRRRLKGMWRRVAVRARWKPGGNKSYAAGRWSFGEPPDRLQPTCGAASGARSPT